MLQAAFWTRMFSRGVSLRLPVGLYLTCVLIAASLQAEEASQPLHQRIDAAVEEAAIGPLAPLCSDADFVRRVYLDLTGVIPTPEQLSEFLADEAPDKRAMLIDRLLESPDFSRHFALQLNILLLDRRADSHVDQRAWETYLIDSIARAKPLDQVFQELVDPNTTGDDATPARKFLLNRDAEPHAMTREVGRMVFGMDLQCAQCHDHPIIDDYYQADYFGLFAFLNRTGKFNDPGRKILVLAEKADGEAPFESVFTGEGRTTTRPRLPWGATLYDEPTFPEEEAYEVKPDNENAAKPAFSRRKVLAEGLPENEQFRRNLANRVWALVMGRGLVHPSDFHYAENPPVNPALLAMLASDLAENQFDLRYLVRELVRTKTYQRSFEPPRPETLNFSDIRSRLDRLSERLPQQIAAAELLQEQVETTRLAWQSALDQTDQALAEIPPLEAQLAEAATAVEQATAEHQEAKNAHEALAAKATPIQEVLTAAKAAVEKTADEPALAQSVALLEARTGELAEAMKATQAALDQKLAVLTEARQKVEQTQQQIATVAARKVEAAELMNLEGVYLAASSSAGQAAAAVKLTEAQIEFCRSLLEYPDLAASDPERAEVAWQEIVDRWTLQGQVAPLKPLSPEQLAASAMRATGVLPRSEAAAQAALEKTPPEELASEQLSEEEKAKVKDVALQAELIHHLRGSVAQFVTQYSGDEFQATVNQALFLGNSPVVHGWLAAAGDTLVGRLAAVEDPLDVADQLSLAIFSRPATREEQQQVAEFLEQAVEQEGLERPAALAELVWAMLASTEFRFNH